MIWQDVVQGPGQIAVKIQDGVRILIVDRLDLDDTYHVLIDGTPLYARTAQGVNFLLAEFEVPNAGFRRSV